MKYAPKNRKPPIYRGFRLHDDVSHCRARLALNPNFDTMGGVEDFVMCRLCGNKTQDFREKPVLCSVFSFFLESPMSRFEFECSAKTSVTLIWTAAHASNRVFCIPRRSNNARALKSAFLAAFQSLKETFACRPSYRTAFSRHFPSDWIRRTVSITGVASAPVQQPSVRVASASS